MTNAGNINRQRVENRLTALKDFLIAAGAEVLTPTNEYELVRFRADGEISIVYRKGKGDRVTLTGQAGKALRAFFGGTSWNTASKTPREWTSAKPDIRTLFDRDGPDCFACAFPMSPEEATRDHLVPLASGGPDHIANKVLMHRACNSQCGHMSAPEKIRMHVEARLARERLP